MKENYLLMFKTCDCSGAARELVYFGGKRTTPIDIIHLTNQNMQTQVDIFPRWLTVRGKLPRTKYLSISSKNFRKL